MHVEKGESPDRGKALLKGPLVKKEQSAPVGSLVCWRVRCSGQEEAGEMGRALHGTSRAHTPPLSHSESQHLLQHGGRGITFPHPEAALPLR